MTLGEITILAIIAALAIAAAIATHRICKMIRALEARVKNQSIMIELIAADTQRLLTHVLRTDGRLNRLEVYRRNADPVNYPVTSDSDLPPGARRLESGQ